MSQEDTRGYEVKCLSLKSTNQACAWMLKIPRPKR